MKTTDNNKVWFITGASSGFGKAISEYAASKGYKVIATARRKEKLDELAATAPEQIKAISMDVTSREQVKQRVNEAIDTFGRIDVLINNAGYGIVGALEETPEEEFRNQMETNFFGAVAVTQEVLPYLRKQGSGAIVNMSSMGGNMSFSGFSAYSASKFALEGASEALAQEVAPFGIKTMIVEPGAFRTEFAGSALKHMPKIKAYDDIVGDTREFAKGMDGTQEGDPYKAARVIDKALRSENTPLRLQLGSDAVEAIKTNAEQLLFELETWRETAVNTNFDD
ncbi:SDR family NAD(P)-dependent oxidoreductase [Aggregatimonas sangjinii]|uniref:SDR family NAD(P)-dependent oxidoreductase n=1 Tax=Aggregatimonas sangjinii TaxID=2583587 RepID=A0A5B7SQF3_9FLAO|nr:oxidoreductase [Aggregatimonas sangjinii]QCW98863.1 SDR family NAD(P)-dependent oxidoreductase [Aggregatimonas sangjinii]